MATVRYSAIQAFAILFALACPRQAHADCILHGPEGARVGDTLTFRLECTSPPDSTVSWEFGDGAVLPESHATMVTHVYAKPGRYSVFVRITGELIPFSILQSVLNPVTPNSPSKSSSLAYDPLRRRLWAANADNHTVAALDAKSLQVLWEKPVGRNPRSLAFDAAGALWVVNQDDATLSVLDGKDGSLLATLRLPYASRPYGLAVDASGRIGYLTLEATGRLLKLDLERRAIFDSLAVCPSPRALAISHDGARVYVARYISPSDRGEVVEVDAALFRKANIIPLQPDLDPDLDHGTSGRGVPNALSALAIAPDGRYAFVAATKANTLRGVFRDGRPLTFETSVRAAVFRLDLLTGKEDVQARLDIDNRSQPSDVLFTRNGAFAFVSTQGSNHVSVLDVDARSIATILRSPDYAGPTYAHMLAPVAMALDGKDSLLFVQYGMSREVGVYDVSNVGRGGEVPRSALLKTVTREALDPKILLGKQIFNNAGDSRMSKDGYISCGVCHMEGGSDGRVWDFTDRGEGLRRTTSLLGRAGTGMGPVHWSANFDEIQDFENDIRGPFGGTGLLSDADFHQGTRSTTLGDRKAGLSPDLDALAAYVASLASVHSSPYRNPDGSLTADGEAGRRIFQRTDVDCARCHSGTGFTDSRLVPDLPSGPLPAGDHRTPQGFLVHDVGTLRPGSGHRLQDTLVGFDTPTLKGVWESGPYLHDGSAATLMDVITVSNPADRHGRTSHLSPREKEQLVAYLMQIDENESGGVGLRPRPGRKGMSSAAMRRLGRLGFRFTSSGTSEGKPDFRDARGRRSPIQPDRSPGAQTHR